MLRRELGLLLPTLVAAQTAKSPEKLASAAYRFEDMKTEVDGPRRVQQILRGLSASGHLLDLHETELAPGKSPHKAHHHIEDEMLFILAGAVDVTMEGRTTRLGPGSVLYVASNVDHMAFNPGTVPARYFALQLGAGE
jgi:XRE family transcriptional regulator, regulator of sulfur utilization